MQLGAVFIAAFEAGTKSKEYDAFDVKGNEDREAEVTLGEGFLMVGFTDLRKKIANAVRSSIVRLMACFHLSQSHDRLVL